MLSDRPSPSLAAEDLTVDRGGVRVLNQVSFTAGPGCLMGVVGPNGAGKSTLFDVIVSLLPATAGRVLIHGKPIAEARGLVAYVPQYVQVNWRLPMSALDVTLLGRTRRIGWFRRPGRADRAAAEDALVQVGMWERRHSMVDELSGGQRQRVFVARALAQGADVLLLDEAFSGVDIASQEALVSMLMKLRDEGRTILLSSHDINHLAHYCDECLCLNCHVCACGAPQDVLTEDVLTELYGPFGPCPATATGWLEMHVDIITEALTGPFQYEFMLRALIVSVLVGVMCPILGVYVVIRGLGFMGDALAHSVLPGMVAAFILGISPFFGAIPMAIATAFLCGYLIRRTGLGEDTSVGILFAGLFALGLVMLTAARGIPVNLEDILLGQVLAVSWTDTFVTLGLAGAVLALILGLHKELVFASFDPSGAAVIGLPTEKLEYLLLGLLSVVVVLALQAVGVILVISMLITPAATALLLMRNFVQAMTAAVIIGAASAVLGLYLSYYFNMPSGPVMALTATGFFVLAAAWKGRPTWLIQQQRA